MMRTWEDTIREVEALEGREYTNPYDGEVVETPIGLIRMVLDQISYLVGVGATTPPEVLFYDDKDDSDAGQIILMSGDHYWYCGPYDDDFTAVGTGRMSND